MYTNMYIVYMLYTFINIYLYIKYIYLSIYLLSIDRSIYIIVIKVYKSKPELNLYQEDFLAIFFSLICLKKLLHQKNSIKSGLSQVPLKFSLIKTNHFKPRFFRQGFNHVVLLLVRTLWHNFRHFVWHNVRLLGSG